MLSHTETYICSIYQTVVIQFSKVEVVIYVAKIFVIAIFGSVPNLLISGLFIFIFTHLFDCLPCLDQSDSNVFFVTATNKQSKTNTVKLEVCSRLVLYFWARNHFGCINMVRRQSAPG